MSQICCEIEATTAMVDSASFSTEKDTTVLDPFDRTFLSTAIVVSRLSGRTPRGSCRNTRRRLVQSFGLAQQCCSSGLDPFLEFGHYSAAGPAGRYRREEFEDNPAWAFE